MAVWGLLLPAPAPALRFEALPGLRKSGKAAASFPAAFRRRRLPLTSFPAFPACARSNSGRTGLRPLQGLAHIPVYGSAGLSSSCTRQGPVVLAGVLLQVRFGLQGTLIPAGAREGRPPHKAITVRVRMRLRLKRGLCVLLDSIPRPGKLPGRHTSFAVSAARLSSGRTSQRLSLKGDGGGSC